MCNLSFTNKGISRYFMEVTWSNAIMKDQPDKSSAFMYTKQNMTGPCWRIQKHHAWNFSKITAVYFYVRKETEDVILSASGLKNGRNEWTGGWINVSELLFWPGNFLCSKCYDAFPTFLSRDITTTAFYNRSCLTGMLYCIQEISLNSTVIWSFWLAVVRNCK